MANAHRTAEAPVFPNGSARLILSAGQVGWWAAGEDIEHRHFVFMPSPRKLKVGCMELHPSSRKIALHIRAPKKDLVLGARSRLAGRGADRRELDASHTLSEKGVRLAKRCRLVHAICPIRMQ